MKPGTQITRTGFDYGGLDQETASKLLYYAKSGHGLVRKNMIRFIADFGEMLSEAQKLLADHHAGTFCKWATAEFDLSKATVYNYVNAWDRVLSNGWTTYAHLSPTALYLLSQDSTPKAVRDKVLRLSVKQDAVTKADVQKLLQTGGPQNASSARTATQQPLADSGGDDASDATDSPETAAEHGDADDSPEVPAGGEDDTDGSADDLVEEFPEDETMESLCQRETSEIESWARKIASLMAEAQKAMADFPTLDELNARVGWERKLNEALATLRGTKPVLCPICGGDGGKKCPCKGHGRVTKQQYGQMV